MAIFKRNCERYLKHKHTNTGERHDRYRLLKKNTCSYNIISFTVLKQRNKQTKNNKITLARMDVTILP